MFDLFKRNKEPLHITRKTVFDNESIPAAALDGDLERRVAALERLGRDIEPCFNDLVDIHKKELTVHHANEVAWKARMDAESAARISSGTIDTHGLNTTNIGEQKRPTKPKKQPHVRIEFDNISNPTVWLDGDKVEALETLDVNWVTDTDQKNTKKFEISYLDLNNPNGPFIKRGQTNQQSSRVGNADGKCALFGSTKDIEKVIECINEAKKDGAIVLFLDELMFDTNVNTLEIVVKSLGYRCTTAKLAFEGEQVSEHLIIITEDRRWFT